MTLSNYYKLKQQIKDEAEKPASPSLPVDKIVIPTVADERYLKQVISFPICNRFKTHPEKIKDVTDQIYADIKERFELIKRRSV